MKTWILSLILILMTQPSWALVNMKNASYSEKWVDIILPGKGYDFRIERFYNSRSLFIGLFGFGWCSDIETKLEIRTDGRLVLTECGGGLEIVYYPQKFDKRSMTRTIDQIIKKHRKKNRSISQKDIKKLRSYLTSNTRQRFEMAKAYGLINGVEIRTKKNTFKPNGKSIEQIYFDGSNYTRKRPNGTTQKFNAKGNLIQETDLKGNFIQIGYNSHNKISSIRDNNGRSLSFAYKPNQELEKIYNGQGVQASYEFAGENLSKATTAWGKSYIYNYDEGHNLTQVLFPDNTTISMSYERRSDWIKSYKDRSNCVQSFRFILSRDDPKNHYTSFVDKKCKDNPKRNESGRMEFWYKKIANSKAKYLDRVLNIISGVHKDTYFHPVYGKPISIARNNSTERYSYYQNGLTHIKEVKAYSKRREVVSWTNSTFKYGNSHKKVSESLMTIFDSKGKRKKVVKTKFSYNKRGLLLSARRPASGQEVKIDYTSSGKISKLIGKKSRFHLTYGTDHEKPETIEQVSVGKVKVRYSLSGDVLKVTSDKGKAVAASVVGGFSQVLDVLGIAAEELLL